MDCFPPGPRFSTPTDSETVSMPDEDLAANEMEGSEEKDRPRSPSEFVTVSFTQCNEHQNNEPTHILVSSCVNSQPTITVAKSKPVAERV